MSNMQPPGDFAPPGGFASPGGRPAAALLPTEQGRRARRSRPAVLEAGRTALIPLRPLTMIEILDAAFVVVRRRPQAMIGLPFLVVLALVGQTLALAIGVWLLGETTSTAAQVILGLLGGLAISIVLVASVMWVSAILTRVSLEVLMGPGFAPAPRRIQWRLLLRMTPAILALTLLELVGAWAVQTLVGFVSYLLLPAMVIPDPVLLWISLIVVLALTLILTCWAASYLALAVPTYMVENRRTPGWIGKPWRPTSPPSAFTRSFGLIGFRHSYRPALVLAGAVLICGAVVYVSTQGFVGLVASLLFTLARDMVFELLFSPLIIGVIIAAQVIGMTVALAYLAAVQSVLYLDLRMRREGLDLALRFDQVAIPQPVPPPPPVLSPPTMGPPTMSPPGMPPPGMPPPAGRS